MSKGINNKDGKKKGNDLLKTLIATGIAGIIIIILMIVIMIQVIGDGKINNKTEGKINKEETNINVETETIEKEMAKVTGVIKTVNKEDRSVSIIDVETDGVINIKLDNTIEIVDEYGKPMTFSELAKGDMIYTKYNKLDGKPEIFRLSSESWEYISNSITVDEINKILYRGNEKYYYTDELIALYNGQHFDIRELTEVDEVVIRGYKNKLCVIELLKSHGYVELKNYDYFINAIMTIDRNKTYVIEELMDKIMLQEGKHKVVIEMEGYDSYVEDIIVIPNSTVKIDLGEIQIKKGQIEFRTDNKDVQVYINEKLVPNIEEPVFLDYGEYNLKVMSEGTILSEEQLLVDTPFMIYNITVKQQEPERSIHINTDPIGAEVYINNQFYGYSPLTLNLDSGNYKVLLIKEGYYTSEYDIFVSDGDEDLFFTFPSMKQLKDIDEQSGEDDDNQPSTPIDDVYGQ